jgi:hypothetical protein
MQAVAQLSIPPDKGKKNPAWRDLRRKSHRKQAMQNRGISEVFFWGGKGGGGSGDMYAPQTCFLRNFSGGGRR